MAQRIKNKRYREFLDTGNINLLSSDDFKKVRNNIRGRYAEEGKALLTILYYTGCRPNEALRLNTSCFTIDGSYMIVALPRSKNGLPRKVYIPLKKEGVRDVWKLVNHLPPNFNLFWHFGNEYIRKVKLKNGTIKERKEITDKLRFFFKRWFAVLGDDSIPPYFLRHNRFSKLAEKGVQLNTLRGLKGAKDPASVMMYLHLSTDESKKAGKVMD